MSEVLAKQQQQQQNQLSPMTHSVFGVDQALERFRTARFRTKYGTDYKKNGAANP